MTDPYPPGPHDPQRGRPGDGEAPTWHGSDDPRSPWAAGGSPGYGAPGYGPPSGPMTFGEPGQQASGGQGGYGPPPRRRRNGTVFAAVAAGVVLLLLLGTGAAYLVAQGSRDSVGASPEGASQSPWPVGSPPVQQANASAPDWTATAEAALPSVVAIAVTSSAGQDAGSGVVLDAQGHVVTNAHVVGSTAAKPEILVTLSDKRAYEASVVGSDPTTDIAVIQLRNPPQDLRPITMGDSDALKVGSPVMAVGNPLRLAGTVTTGIVSALNRPVQTLPEGSKSAKDAVVTNAIQISAAINPGNSGGALVNASGQLIGLNSSIAQTSEGGGNIGIGFAIPSTEVRSVSAQLLRTGTVKHPLLGVQGAQTEYVREGNAQRAAAVVGTVQAGSPAQKAGLRAGDGIVAVDNDVVDSWLALVAQVREKSVGQTITLTIVRDGQRSQVKATLSEMTSS